MARTSVTIEGVPDMQAALERVARELEGPAAEAAMMKAGRVIADQWAAGVPVGEQPADPHPGAYRRAMQSADAVQVQPADGGQIGLTVGPAFLEDLPPDEQPRAYAGVLEYGNAARSPQPSARAAWEIASPKAVAILSDELGRAAEQVR
jgi:HK97 gp10 family phage protein